MYTNTDYIHMAHFPSAFYLPLLLAFFCSPFAPSAPLLLTLNPPCCDRIRPRCPRKLTLPFPSSGSYTPHSKIPTPWSLPTPNIHSLGQQCEPSSQDRAHLEPNGSKNIIDLIFRTILDLKNDQKVEYWPESCVSKA